MSASDLDPVDAVSCFEVHRFTAIRLPGRFSEGVSVRRFVLLYQCYLAASMP